MRCGAGRAALDDAGLPPSAPCAYHRAVAWPPTRGDERDERGELDALRGAGLRAVERIGCGASSAVYALDEAADDGTPLALKLLHAEHAGSLELVLRFLNEERAAARVRHPGVVRIHGAGQLAARPYLVLERLADTLAQRAARLTRGERLAVAAQVASGAAALHRANVVHRDLKPANILFALGPEPRACIIDLGLAKVSRDLSPLPVSTAATEVIGTAEYRAPELWISAKDVDGRADVYSLGVIVYELLVGALPFQGDRESVLMDLHLFAPPPRLDAAGELAPLLRTMLAKARAGRPDMDEVAAALAAASHAR